LLQVLDAAALRQWCTAGLEALTVARQEIDALNVYPVPDGDTGTNMFLTVESARDAMVEAMRDAPDDLRLAMRAYAKGALLGARGNSGVILSQLVGALLRRIGKAGPDDRSAAVFAEGMALATEAAYAAVGTPVEGTILTVARAASEAAAKAAQDPDDRLGDVVRAAASAAREALAHTPAVLIWMNNNPDWTRTVGNAFTYQPNDVITLPNGDILVAEGHNDGTISHRIVHFDKNGKYLSQFGKRGNGPGEFMQPHTMALDSQGRLFVGDRGNNRVQIMTTDGKFIAEWAQFSRPSGIFIDKNDMLYSADSESGNVKSVPTPLPFTWPLP